MLLYLLFDGEEKYKSLVAKKLSKSTLVEFCKELLILKFLGGNEGEL